MALGAIGAYLGIAVWVGSLAALGLVLLASACLLIYIKLLEEKEMVARFGANTDYRVNTFHPAFEKVDARQPTCLYGSSGDPDGTNESSDQVIVVENVRKTTVGSRRYAASTCPSGRAKFRTARREWRGQTTLIKTLVGSTHPLPDRSRTRPEPGQAGPRRAARSGMPQAVVLYEDLSPRDNLRCGRAHGKDRSS
jgi:hypothetical protein